MRLFFFAVTIYENVQKNPRPRGHFLDKYN
jgi:hypothetical protein